MDRRRYQELADKDRQLEERLRGWKRSECRTLDVRTVRHRPGLVYSDAYAEAAYNPKKVEPRLCHRNRRARYRLRPSRRAGLVQRGAPNATHPRSAVGSDGAVGTTARGPRTGDVRVAERPRPRSSVLLRLLTVAAVVALLGFVVWLVFVKRWGGEV
jgi:hypothetical protein